MACQVTCTSITTLRVGEAVERQALGSEVFPTSHVQVTGAGHRNGASGTQMGAQQVDLTPSRFN